MGEVHIGSRSRGGHAPTLDEIRDVEVAFAGAETFLDLCELRPCDVTWWERETRRIVDAMREQVRIAAMTDDEIAALLTPEERQRGGAFGGVMNARDVQEHVARTRLKCGWMLSLGALDVGWTRIELESIHMDKRVQNARRQVRAFVLTAEIAVGMAYIASRDDDDASSERAEP